MTGLVLSQELLPAALAIQQREARWLHEHWPEADLVLIGGSSVSGALTVGDIDLHCRVRGSFARAVAVLSERYVVRRAEMWLPTLATFLVPDSRPVELAATPAGSEHDVRFTRGWKRLRTDPAVLEEYNKLKRDFHGSDEYEARKAEFFTRLTSN